MQVHSGRAAISVLLLSCAAMIAATLSCRREASHPSTGTIAPAPPRPSPVSPETIARLSQLPVTTSGSPPPFPDTHEQFEPVVLRRGSIDVRKLVPAGATVFRITNGDTVPRRLAIDGQKTHAALEKPLAPGETVMLQLILNERHYALRDPDAPSRGRAVVKTYIPR